MRALLLLVTGLLLASACGLQPPQPPVASPAPTQPPQPTAVTTPVAAATVPAVPTIAIAAVPTVDPAANIRVITPRPAAPIPLLALVEGEARVFEANVQLRVVDPAGRELVRTFTTATVAAPEWGRFSVRLQLPPGASGPANLEVFSLSARDGSVQNLVVVPVEIRQ